MSIRLVLSTVDGPCSVRRSAAWRNEGYYIVLNNGQTPSRIFRCTNQATMTHAFGVKSTSSWNGPAPLKGLRYDQMGAVSCSVHAVDQTNGKR